MSSVIYSIVDIPYTSNPFSSTAKRMFRICVPDEWYRRSKPRNMTLPSFEPSEETIKRLAALHESKEIEDEDEDDEGTAKLGVTSNSDSHSSSTTTASPKVSSTPNRLSSFFDGWLRPTSPTTPSRDTTVLIPGNRKSVSEPRLIESASSLKRPNASDRVAEGLDEEEFEMMLVCLTLFGNILIFMVLRIN